MSNLPNIALVDLDALRTAIAEAARQTDETAWTVEDCARYLKVNADTVYDLVNLGAIPHFRIGKLKRFHPQQVRQWSGETNLGQGSGVSDRVAALDEMRRSGKRGKRVGK